MRGISSLPWLPIGAAATTLLLGLAACPRGGELRPAPCGRDVDCKGTRICDRGACAEPVGRSTATIPAAGAPVDAGAAVEVPLPGASPLFHVDRAHSGRSRFRISTSAPTEIARVRTGGTVVSSPAITSDGVALFGSHDRSIRAAAPSESRDGGVEIRWSRPTGDLVWCSPALGPGGPGEPDVLYVGSDDDRLYALAATDGAVKWTFTAGPCRRAVGIGPEAARCDVDGVTIAPDGSILFVADGAYSLHRDGTLRFRYPLSTHCGAAPAVAPDGTVVFGCQDGRLYALAPDGTKRWDYKAGDDIDSSPAIAPDGTVYFGSDDGKLYALAPGGELKWSVRTGGPVRAAPAIALDGTVYAGSFDGAFYAVRPDGVIAWTFRAADRIASSAAIDADGNLLFGAEDDRLYALAPDGRLLWSVLLDGDVDATPAIGPGGTIYIGADDKALHILR